MAAAPEDPAAAASGSPGEYEQLKLIQSFIGSKLKKEIVIKFSLDGKEYNTTFKIEYIPNFGVREHFRIYNGCINLEYKPGPAGKLDSWQSSLKKNTNDIKAFKTAGAEFGSSLDMLQIVTTKLRLCMPGVQLENITITDEAKLVPGTYLSDFKILRGGRPVYEKYGYFSKLYEIWDQISAEAVRAESWNKVKEHLEVDTVSAMDGFFAEKHIVVAETASITDIMKQIAIDDDKFSTPIVESLCKKYNPEHRVPSGFRSFVLAAASDTWTTSKHRLIITSVTEIAKGGYRTTKRRKQKQQRQQSLNKERTNSNNGRTLQTTRTRKGSKRR